MIKFTKSALLLSAASTLCFAGMATAQVTTGQVGGVVTTEGGAPISGASITITNSQTGFTRTVTSNSNGQFAVRNLSVSGLYDINVTGAGYQGERVEDVGLSLGGTTSMNFDLAGGSSADEIIVVGQRSVLTDVAIGPSATFSRQDLDTLPAINRDLKDVIRLDPRIFVDESFNDAIQCAGANPRFNSLTVDGVRLNDNFGLNSNGFPGERMPFSFDAIEQVSVELAPFDVEFGGFTACNINAVTKSGTNEIHGGAFFDYTTAGLKGSDAGSLSVSNDGFEEYRYGANVSVPIIKDKVFLFAAYEKLKGSNLFGSNTPAGTGLTTEYDEIIAIAEGQYGYVSGGLPSTKSNFDEKLLVKLDWDMNSQHRMALTYNYNDGNNISGSDTGSNRLSDGNHFYERGAKLQSLSGKLYSDWSDKLSTEIGVSYLDVKNRQIPIAGTEFGEIQIRNQGPRGTTVYLGADDSRHANKLTYNLTSWKAKADYQAGNHTLTAGFENEVFDVFNLFIQEVQGEWAFNSIDDFRNGDFSDFRYENAAGSNNQDDGAATFGFSISALYAQDSWQATDALNITAGLRYETMSSSDVPAFNQNFFDDYGFGNDVNLDGKSIFQPRLGFNYEATDKMEIHGGVGLFSGGNPNVWISNNYSNNGVTLFEYRLRNGGNVANFTYPNSGNVFFEVPQEGIDAVANASGRGAVNAIDPDFKLPSEWKFSLGTVINADFGSVLGDDYLIQLDMLYSKTKEAANIRNLELTPNGVAPDGRPLLSGFPFNDFLLTNADDKGSALVLSAGVSKDFDWGNWGVGYAYTEAKDVNPMTSSVAFSNNANYATSDILNPGLATTNYEIPHRFTFNLNLRKDLIEDLTTTFSIFGSHSQGRPFSYTFQNCDDTGTGQRCAGEDVAQFEGGYDDIRRQLLYVPTGPNDPLVMWADPAEQSAFFAWAAENGLDQYAGGIAPRNAFNSDWWTKIDLKIKQEFPGFRSGDKASAFIVLENALNFIDSDWGVLRQTAFPSTENTLDVSFADGDTSQYIYRNFRPNAGDGQVQAGASTWEVRFGVNYDF